MEESNTPSLRDSIAETMASLSGEPAPEKEVSPDDGLEASSEEQTAAVTENTVSEEEPKKVFDPPKHWSQEDRDAFAKLDDVGKELMSRVSGNWESGLNKKMEELAEQRKRYSGFDSFTETLQSQYPTMSRDQISEAVVKALPQLVSTYSSMVRDPVGTLRKLADAYNVADKLSESLLGQDNDESARISRLRETELEQENVRLRTEQQRVAREQADREIAKFRDETGADGKPLRPYFSELEPHMARLIQSDPSITLQRAYDMAMRTEKHEELIKQAREQALKEAEAERRRKANGRTASKPTLGKSNGSGVSQKAPVKDLRQAIREQYEELQSRQ